ncbi:hypothetical protein [Nocardia neocaledoniensis]|uniref:hypothetical protein n=1 Tax=Nocardia neocaledoniensis TaxID=236511 RepID=UPI00245678F6|nr:hypothetical protein [Nocardia neocaledoniensis]
MAAPKKYPDELKARAVRLYRESDPKPTIRKLAAQLGYITKRCGCGSARRRPMPANATTSRRPDMLAENRALKKRVAELERVNAVLRDASAYFASELGQTRR